MAHSYFLGLEVDNGSGNIIAVEPHEKKLEKDGRQKYAKSLWSFPSLPKYVVSPFASKMKEEQKLPAAPDHFYSRNLEQTFITFLELN